MGLLGPSVGLIAAQITKGQNSCDNISEKIAAKIAKKNEFKQAKDDADNAEEIEGAEFHVLANIIKADPGYTTGKGSSFGIINSNGAVFDSSTYKSTIKLTHGNGYVGIKFTKKGVVGLNIYTRLQGTSQWTHLILSTHSPYHDHHPLADSTKPEVREYMAIGVVNDAEIGMPSDIASITFAG